ncbi:hypothetical protein SKAU_G00092410 [Synaphobranchus kaupii]|uniref:Uncharacterized protein n=1 Tax=Synaphobranchus kaupii TaxID=118154 RepID=A0A9Q1J6M2_SYNKA|nr:hypothetical protein SKAU_G00092410 [Synaphobranchus kaupii]
MDSFGDVTRLCSERKRTVDDQQVIGGERTSLCEMKGRQNRESQGQVRHSWVFCFSILQWFLSGRGYCHCYGYGCILHCCPAAPTGPT